MNGVSKFCMYMYYIFEREIVSVLNINIMYNYIFIIEFDCCICRNVYVYV